MRPLLLIIAFVFNKIMPVLFSKIMSDLYGTPSTTILPRKKYKISSDPLFCPDINHVENAWGRMELKLQREYENPTNSDKLYVLYKKFGVS